jgi:hypothetical protein
LKNTAPGQNPAYGRPVCLIPASAPWSLVARGLPGESFDRDPSSEPRAESEIQEICHSGLTPIPSSRGGPPASVTDPLNFQPFVGRVTSWRVCALLRSDGSASSPSGRPRNFDVLSSAVRTFGNSGDLSQRRGGKPAVARKTVDGCYRSPEFPTVGVGSVRTGRENRVRASEGQVPNGRVAKEELDEIGIPTRTRRPESRGLVGTGDPGRARRDRRRPGGDR